MLPAMMTTGFDSAWPSALPHGGAFVLCSFRIMSDLSAEELECAQRTALGNLLATQAAFADFRKELRPVLPPHVMLEIEDVLHRYADNVRTLNGLPARTCVGL